MSKKAIISIDFASLVGTLRFHPGIPLPRHDKRQLEQSVSASLLTTMMAHGRGQFADLSDEAILEKLLQLNLERSGR